jgi:hypothetical protein
VHPPTLLRGTRWGATTLTELPPSR